MTAAEGQLEDLEARPGSVGSLLRTFVGVHLRAIGGWIAVADLVRLCGDAGASPIGARSALSRLKSRGLLESRALGGVTGYALADGAVRMLERGDRRIFSYRPMTEGEGWMLVVFSVPEHQRHRRHRLRTRLRWLGCGVLGPGTWIGPAHLIEETLAVLAEDGLREYVTVLRADDPRPPVPLSEAVRVWWNLTELDDRYVAFLESYRAVLGDPVGPDRHAFATHLRLVDDWRALPYLDPGLPEHLRPEGSRARSAVELFAELNARLAGPAAHHVTATVAGSNTVRARTRKGAP